MNKRTAENLSYKVSGIYGAIRKNHKGGQTSKKAEEQMAVYIAGILDLNGGSFRTCIFSV